MHWFDSFLPLSLTFLASWTCIHQGFAFTPPLLHKQTRVEHSSLAFKSPPLSIQNRQAALHSRLGDNDDNKQEVSYLEKPKRRGRTTGGRRRRKVLILNTPTTKEQGSKFPAWLGVVGVPLLAALIFVRSLFGDGTSSEYVYYQSSVYESRVYTSDGRVETSRKESVQSNVPSLLEDKRLKDTFGYFLLEESPDDNFERELESMMRIQQSLLDEFF